MQVEKKKRKIPSRGKYMDIIRPPKTSRKKPAIIEATHITTEIYDPEIDDIETVEELELSMSENFQPKTTPKPRSIKKEYPFISSVNVDKRPLSPYVPKNSTATSRPTKNIYSATKPIKKVKKPTEKPIPKPTKVVEPPKKSGLSLAVIIIITVILGAAAGVGAYLLLPH